MIEQGDEERLVAETLKVNPILFEANSMQSLLMVFNQVVDLSQSEYYFTWLIENIVQNVHKDMLRKRKIQNCTN